MKIPCLSIQQPWAAMILTGEKRVENRERTWMRGRDWQIDGKILLAIHSSRGKKQQVWTDLTNEKKDQYAPDWRNDDCIQFGSVLGLVDLVCICRPNNLPADLQNHEYVVHSRKNWCWVLQNPRRLEPPIRCRGNSALFYVNIPAAALLRWFAVIDSCKLTVTQGNLNNGSLCVTAALDLFPQDVFGTSSQRAKRTVSVLWGDQEVKTDIVRPKSIFRRRTWGQFFDASRTQAGNQVLLEQLDPYLYRISSPGV